MLTIRREQVVALSESRIRSSDESLMARLGDVAPFHARLVGSGALLEFIRLGRARAARYSLTLEGEVILYLSLMASLGSSLDTDVQIPWAGEILNERFAAGQFSKILALYDRAGEYLDEVYGPGACNLRAALARIPNAPVDSAAPHTVLREIFPEKFDAAGSANMERLLAFAAAEADRLGLHSSAAGTLGAAMLILGQGFLDDPLYAWAAAILAQDVSEPAARLHAFAAEAGRQVSLWLAMEAG